jgi:hypothetical protein
MRPLRQLLAGLVLCAAAAPGALSQPGPGQAAKQVRLVIGNLVAANKTIGVFQGIGPVLIRTELTRFVGRNPRIKLCTSLEKDQNFQLDEKIGDEERRGASLKAATLTRLSTDRINYFIFLTYLPIDDQHIKVTGQLAEIKANESSVIQSEQTTVNLQNPELTTFGQELYDDIVQREDPSYVRRSFSLVFCNENAADLAADYVSSSVKRSFAGERPRLVDAIKGRPCTEGQLGSALEILVHCRVRNMRIEVELMYSDQTVAFALLHLVSPDQFMQDPDCEKKIDELIQQIRESYGNWSPPS